MKLAPLLCVPCDQVAGNVAALHDGSGIETTGTNEFTSKNVWVTLKKPLNIENKSQIVA